LQLTLYNEQDDLFISFESLQKLASFVLDYLLVQTDELVLHFVTIEKITELHGEFFDDPTPTDCISFPLDGKSKTEGPSVLGEVFVCPKVAIEYAKEYGGTPEEEASLYVIHGILHLIGYADHTPEMTEKQDEVLSAVKKAHLLRWE
jgi:probable rRNA maturation factor